MAHSHDVLDDDKHFKIDANTRTITRMSENELLLIQGDHNSERCTFEIPSLIDGHNMELCNIVRVHFINVNADNPMETSIGLYEVDDHHVLDNDPSTMQFSWLISGEATEFIGTLSFLVEFGCKNDDDVIDYLWHSGIYTGGVIQKGMNNSEIVIGQHYDVLNRWVALIDQEGNRVVTETLSRLDTAAKQTEENALKAIDKHAEEVKKDLTSYGLDVHDILVQKTGNSDDKVMSQASVTGEINRLDDSITAQIVAVRSAFNAVKTELNEAMSDAATRIEVPVNVINNIRTFNIEIGKKYLVESTKTDNSWGFDFKCKSFICYDRFNTVYALSAPITFNSEVDKYATGCITFQLLRVEFETVEATGGEGTLFAKHTFEINGERHTQRMSIGVTEMGSDPYTIDYCEYVLERCTKVYEQKDLPDQDGYKIDVNSIVDISKTKTATVNGVVTHTYTITFSDGTTTTFDVKDGVGISSFSIITHGDYEDTYRVNLTNGTNVTFKVPNSNTVGIVTSESGPTIHAENLIPLEHTVKTKVRSKNLWSYKPNTDINGVTITTDVDGKITYNGVCSESFVIYETISLEAGTYILSDSAVGTRPTVSDARTQIYIPELGIDARIEHNHASNKTATFTLQTPSNDVRLRIKGATGFSYSNYVISPQLERADTSTPYTPYVNPADVTLRRCGKNLIPYPYAYGNGTIEGIVYKNNKGGTVTVNGTATTNSSIHYLVTTPKIHLVPGTYTLSGCPSGGSQSTYRLCVKTEEAVPEYYYDTGTGNTFTITEDKMVQIYIYVGPGASVDNLTFKPQLEVGNKATDYESYIGEEYGITSDGTPVSRVTSVSPIMNLVPDKSGVIIDATYNESFVGDHIVRRETDGNIIISGTPTADTHAAPKKYVDDKHAEAKKYVDNKLANVKTSYWDYTTWSSGEWCENGHFIIKITGIGELMAQILYHRELEGCYSYGGAYIYGSNNNNFFSSDTAIYERWGSCKDASFDGDWDEGAFYIRIPYNGDEMCNVSFKIKFLGDIYATPTYDTWFEDYAE